MGTSPRLPLLAAYLACALGVAAAHSAWSCPGPRSPDTSLKRAPCGGADEANGGAWGSAGVTVMKPGKIRVTFVESIIHMVRRGGGVGAAGRRGAGGVPD